jgi:hypothetical protein
MAEIWYYLLPPPVFVGAMFLCFKLLQAVGATSLSDFEVTPEEAVNRNRASGVG